MIICETVVVSKRNIKLHEPFDTHTTFVNDEKNVTPLNFKPQVSLAMYCALSFVQIHIKCISASFFFGIDL